MGIKPTSEIAANYIWYGKKCLTLNGYGTKAFRDGLNLVICKYTPSDAIVHVVIDSVFITTNHRTVPPQYPQPIVDPVVPVDTIFLPNGKIEKDTNTFFDKPEVLPHGDRHYFDSVSGLLSSWAAHPSQYQNLNSVIERNSVYQNGEEILALGSGSFVVCYGTGKGISLLMTADYATNSKGELRPVPAQTAQGAKPSGFIHTILITKDGKPYETKYISTLFEVWYCKEDCLSLVSASGTNLSFILGDKPTYKLDGSLENKGTLISTVVKAPTKTSINNAILTGSNTDINGASNYIELYASKQTLPVIYSASSVSKRGGSGADFATYSIPVGTPDGTFSAVVVTGPDTYTDPANYSASGGNNNFTWEYPTVEECASSSAQVVATDTCGNSGSKTVSIGGTLPVLTVSGAEAYSGEGTYTATGGRAPYTWTYPTGCGMQNVTVTDDCGNSASMSVRMPTGTWTLTATQGNPLAGCYGGCTVTETISGSTKVILRTDTIASGGAPETATGGVFQCLSQGMYCVLRGYEGVDGHGLGSLNPAVEWIWVGRGSSYTLSKGGSFCTDTCDNYPVQEWCTKDLYVSVVSRQTYTWTC